MYCNQCGKKINDGAKFCQECGARAPEQGDIGITSPDGSWDLTSKANQVINKGAIITAIILAVASVAYCFLVRAFAEVTDLNEGRIDLFALFTIACSSVPFGVIGLPIVLGVKKKLGDLAKPPKGSLTVFVVLFTFMTALSQVLGFADLVEDAGSIIRLLGTFLYIGAVVTYLIYAARFAQDCGLGGIFTLLIAFFISFLIGFVVSFLALRALAILAIVLVLGVVFSIVAEQKS